eukprot:5718929-Karenia_brevis.AAC.1
MKFWALRGFECCSRMDHRNLKKDNQFGSMPNDDELERMREKLCPADRAPSPVREDEDLQYCVYITHDANDDDGDDDDDAE